MQVITLFPLGGLSVRTWPGTFLASLIGAALLVVAALLARPAVAVDVWLARALLGPGSFDRRMRELERTRSLAVDGAAAALRQVERDLHDGAQVRLTSLALHLVVSSLMRAQRAGLAALTPRERQVLSLMAEGRSNSGIAAALVLTEGAVEKHIASIFGKVALEPMPEDNRRVLAVLRYLHA